MQQQIRQQQIAELRRIELISEESKNVAASTNLHLYQNGQKLERIDGKLNNINRELNKAEVSSKQITSYWYHLKVKAKRFLGFSSDHGELTPPTNKIEGNKHNHREEQTDIHYKIDETESSEISQQDKILQNIIKNVKTAKNHAKQMGKQIDRQNPLIDGINTKLTNANVKMAKVNGILVKEINR